MNYKRGGPPFIGEKEGANPTSNRCGIAYLKNNIYLQDLEQNLYKNEITSISNIAKGSIWNPQSVGKEKKIIRKMIFLMFVFTVKNINEI